MKNLFDKANQYVKKSDWRMVSLVKLCLGALGVMIGLAVPSDKKKCAYCVALPLFLAAYLPLMADFIRFFADKQEKETAENE